MPASARGKHHDYVEPPGSYCQASSRSQAPARLRDRHHVRTGHHVPLRSHRRSLDHRMIGPRRAPGEEVTTSTERSRACRATGGRADQAPTWACARNTQSWPSGFGGVAAHRRPGPRVEPPQLARSLLTRLSTMPRNWELHPGLLAASPHLRVNRQCVSPSLKNGVLSAWAR